MTTYESSGVSLDAADEAVARLKSVVGRATRPEVLGGIGGFGGLFNFDSARYDEPVLVSATDGVGTKLELARELGRLGRVGFDLVAMVVDDLVCCGAEPLFLLDYVAVGKTDPRLIEAVVAGIADACVVAGCALIGGEIAEHPGVLPDDQIDLAGFAVGVVERSALITGESIAVGDAVIGMASPGLRSNGFSLVRKIAADASLDFGAPAPWDRNISWADAVLEPSVIYTPAIKALLSKGIDVRGVVHITGGGLPGNVPRVLPEGMGVSFSRDAWEVPKVMLALGEMADVSDSEMARTFNLGIGMVVVVPQDAVDATLSHLALTADNSGPHAARSVGVVGEVNDSGMVTLH